MIDITRALQISTYQCQGRTDELTWLARQASTRKFIVEVGCFMGATAVAMADNTDGLVYCVDDFKGVGLPKEFLAEIEKDPEWLYNTFYNNTKDSKNIMTIRLTSLDAARHLKDWGYGYQADMVFIDADHCYEAVSADIKAWLPLIYKGGIISGHDRQWQGVSQAIDELVPGHKVGAGAIWYKEIE